VRVETQGQRSFVTVPARLKKGANVRKAGEDLAEGSTLFEPGTLLRPQDLAALASVGCVDVACYARLKVAIVSSGDEVVRTGAALGTGQVYDANAPMLVPLIAEAGAEAVDLGVLPDKLEAVEACLADA
ncbi:molybdopterin molybdenumtransferase MoeA, partial [Herbaspirillum sp. HC18]